LGIFNEQPMLPLLSIKPIKGEMFLRIKFAFIKEIQYWFEEISTLTQA